MRERIGHLCFVGVSRAVKWVYMSGKTQALIAPMQELGQNTARRFIETMISREAVGLLGPRPVDNRLDGAGDAFGLD
jgi:hypothetical protein